MKWSVWKNASYGFVTSDDSLLSALERTIAQPANAASAAPVTGQTIDAVQKAFDEMRSAFSSGDFTRAGQKLEELKRILQP